MDLAVLASQPGQGSFTAPALPQLNLTPWMLQQESGAALQPKLCFSSLPASAAGGEESFPYPRRCCAREQLLLPVALAPGDTAATGSRDTVPLGCSSTARKEELPRKTFRANFNKNRRMSKPISCLRIISKSQGDILQTGVGNEHFVNDWVYLFL